MNAPERSSRLMCRFLPAIVVATLIFSGALQAQADQAKSPATRPLMAYVGTFSSPLGDVPPSQVDLLLGDRPRHFDFHPNGRCVYSIQEEESTIALFDCDATAVIATDPSKSLSRKRLNSPGLAL